MSARAALSLGSSPSLLVASLPSLLSFPAFAQLSNKRLSLPEAEEPSASTSANGAGARFARSKLRSPARKAVDLVTRVVSAVRGRQGSGKVERLSSRGQPEGSVWLEAHIYFWQEGTTELIDAVCVCTGSAAPRSLPTFIKPTHSVRIPMNEKQ